jgi:hypothetical protein
VNIKQLSSLMAPPSLADAASLVPPVRLGRSRRARQSPGQSQPLPPPMPLPPPLPGLPQAQPQADAMAAALQPREFDPSDEYRRLLEATDPRAARRRWPGARQQQPPPSGTDRGDDVYQHLMSRERRVLDTVDRVVNDAAKSDARADTLASMPLHELAMRSVSAVRSVFEDLVACRTLDDLRRALTIEQARRPFVGLALVAAAVLIGMLQMCGGG